MTDETKDTKVRDIAADIVGACGVGLIGLGSWLIYPPAAYIIVGAILIVGAVMAARE